MKKKLVYLSMALSVVGFLSCSNSATILDNKQSQDVQKVVAENVSVQEFNKMISDSVIILDVRTSREYESGHLANSILIDISQNDFMEKVAKLDKDKKVLIYCASGGRSARAMNKMKSLGFGEMYNMLGGFGTWKNSNLPYEK